VLLAELAMLGSLVEIPEALMEAAISFRQSFVVNRTKRLHMVWLDRRIGVES